MMETLEELKPKIEGIARTITYNREDQKDLFQEMWLHGFEERNTLRDKTKAYILRSCYFHAKHYINEGKSIDSKRRDGTRVVSLYQENDKGEEEMLSIPGSFPSPWDVAITNIMIEEISNLLSEVQKYIFELLLQGYTSAEISRIKKTSRAAISKNLKNIRRKVSIYLTG